MIFSQEVAGIMCSLAPFMHEAKAPAAFEARTHDGVPLHENGAQVTQKLGFKVELFAQAVDRNEIEAKIEFS